jgi:hypothetical protein
VIAKKKPAPSKQGSHLLKWSMPREVTCKVCGVKTTVKGANAYLLCAKHRQEHRARVKADSRREREKKQKDDQRNRALRDMRKAGGAAIGAGPDPAVRAPPPFVRRGQGDGANAPVSPAQGESGSFAQAVRLITSAEQRREGWRHGFIGNTGTGKTTATRALIDIQNRGFGAGGVPTEILTLIHDDAKLDPQYAPRAGTDALHWVAESFDNVPETAHTITLRGDAFRGTTVEVEQVAGLALTIARASREPVRLVIDELDRACTRGGRELDSPSLRVALTQGRALGVSVLWSTQTPQRAPIEVIDQSSTIGIFQLGPRALNYLDERLCFDAELLAVVPGLAVGQFVIYEQGRPWNRIIYRTPGP